MARESQPDILLLDLALPGEKGPDFVPSLLEEGKFHIIILSANLDQIAIDRVVLKGARGIVRKEEPIQTIQKAIQKVYEGEVWLDRTTISHAFINFCRANGRAPDDSNSVTKKILLLTPKERAIAHTFAEAPGATNKRIAQALGISERTLRNQLPSVFRKPGVSNRFELFMFAKLHHCLLDASGDS